MAQQDAKKPIDNLLSPTSPKVSKRNHRKAQGQQVDQIYSDMDQRFTAFGPTLLNFFANGADAMADANITLTGIKDVGGVPGGANKVIFTPFQNEAADRDLWRMKEGAWERVAVPSYFQLLVLVNAGTHAGRLFIQTSPPPYTYTSGKVWLSIGRLQGTGNWSKWDIQKVTAQATNADGDAVSSVAVTYPFSGKIEVKLYGESVDVWDGEGSFQTATAYFCVGTSKNARKNGEVQPGDVLRWNGSQYAYLEGGERLTFSGVVSTIQTRPAGEANDFIFSTFTTAQLNSLATGSETKLIIHTTGTQSSLYKWDSVKQELRKVFDF